MSAADIDAGTLAEKGHEANRRGDWAAALSHWALFHVLYPSRPEGYLHAGDALWRLKHSGAADDILRRGIERFPDNENIALSHGWAALDRRNWAEAEARFGLALARFPASVTPRFGIAMARRELGRLEEAEAILLEDANQQADPASLHMLAELATSLGNFDTAIARWRSALAVRPDDPELHIGFVGCLRAAKREGEAEQALLTAIQLFPGNEDVALSRGWTALDRRDWAEAETRFGATLERFPGSIAARFGLALALRELAKLEEAEAVILEGSGHDSDPASQQLLAELATSLGKFDTAIARWRALLTLQPVDLDLHVALAECLRAAKRDAEAEQALQTAIELFPGNETLLRDIADIAETAENWPLALRRWESFKNAFGSLPDGYIGAAYALMRLGRLDDAEVVMTPAVRLFANNINALTLFAEIAGDSGRWVEAAARWRAAQKLAPERSRNFLGEVEALNGAGRTDEANDLLAELLARFPHDLEVACTYARAPGERRAWREAIERWRAVAAKFPREAQPRAELVRCLTEAGDFAEAEAAAAKALAQLPGNPDLLLAQAEIATRGGDAAIARTRWAALVDRAPNRWDAAIGYARHLVKNGELREAVGLLAVAAPRFRSVLSFNLERAKIIGEMRDWPRALPLWAELWPRAAGNRDIRSEIDRIVALARHDLELAAADAPDAPPPFVIPPALLRTGPDEAREREGAKALMMRFESLGDTCEFGTVQRRFGAEPLSLLRWTGTPPVQLAAAFRAGLKGIGEPEFTEMEVVGGEYVTTDTRYHMFSHTFTMETTAPRDKFYLSQCKRMRFLRDKLLQDLKAPEKIFVYGSALLNDERIDALFTAIRGLGPRATLLCVRLADDRHPAGSVRLRREGLLIGAIRGFSTVDIAVSKWLQICAAAVDMTSEEVRQSA
jgi:tetratricopeptide (TPR) repeat protein